MDQSAALLALSALAQPTRLDTFKLLVANEPRGVSAGEIARLAGVPQNTMSAHLGVLARAGLIVGERSSRSVLYRADLDGFRALVAFLLKDCCEGRAEICGPLLDEFAPTCANSTAAA